MGAGLTSSYRKRWQTDAEAILAIEHDDDDEFGDEDYDDDEFDDDDA